MNHATVEKELFTAFRSVTPNRDAFFLLAESCGAMRCGAVRISVLEDRTMQCDVV